MTVAYQMKKNAGKICVSYKLPSQSYALAYYNNPTATKSSFYPDPECPTDDTKKYFRTGDLASLDAEDFLFLAGRSKELINRAGEKISPLEIDHVLLSHPEIVEAVCFGVSSELYGQEVEAVVVLKSANVDKDAIKLYVGERLAKFKVPRRFHIVEEVRNLGFISSFIFFKLPVLVIYMGYPRWTHFHKCRFRGGRRAKYSDWPWGLCLRKSFKFKDNWGTSQRIASHRIGG